MLITLIIALSALLAICSSFLVASEIVRDLTGINKTVTFIYNFCIQVAISAVFLVAGFFLIALLIDNSEILNSTDSTPAFIRAVVAGLFYLICLFMLVGFYGKQKDFFLAFDRKTLSEKYVSDSNKKSNPEPPLDNYDDETFLQFLGRKKFIILLLILLVVVSNLTDYLGSK